MTKIQFWKQFTTCENRWCSFTALYSVWQRYNFESNLQRGSLNYWHLAAVFSMTKIQFWKQFTTVLKANKYASTLYSVWQRYNFESNLQRYFFWDVFFRAVFSMTKIQFWKQFTTCSYRWCSFAALYSVWQRYNFESNLQHTVP